MNKNLILLGMMGVGKTTIGRILAKKLNLEFVDTDEHIEKKNSMSITEIFEKNGEKFFRTEEENEISKLSKKDGCVFALGGGAFMNEVLREHILKNCLSIWLDIDLNILVGRTSANKNRPLLKNINTSEKIKEIYKERKNIYALANHKINCDKLNKNDIVKKISKLYEK